MSKINSEGFLELSGVNRVGGAQEVLHAEKFPILKGMTPLSLRVLNQSSRVMNVAKGVELMRAGDTPHDLYFITKGSIAVVKKNAGKMQVVAKLKAGDLYGEYGALRGKTRFASIYTSEPSTIVRVDLNSIQQVLEAGEGFRERIYQMMKERMLSSFLFSHPVFQTLSPSARTNLSKSLRVIELARDEVLFAAGSAATDFYMILSGEAEVFVGSGKGSMVVEIRRDNDVLGETRAENGAKYAYSAMALNNLDVLVLSKQAMQMIHQAAPKALLSLNQFMNQQMKKTMRSLKALSAQSAS